MNLTDGLIGPLIVACSLFMESADANILVTALPSMARDFGSDAVTLKIAITSYVVSLGVFIPVCGWLADRFGSRSVFLLCSISSIWITRRLPHDAGDEISRGRLGAAVQH